MFIFTIEILINVPNSSKEDAQLPLFYPSLTKPYMYLFGQLLSRNWVKKKHEFQYMVKKMCNKKFLDSGLPDLRKYM